MRAGESVVQETLHFDPRTEAITSLRSKEEAHDYRYFPEPDLPPVLITQEMLDRARAAMPELPADRERRLIDEVGLNAESARLLSWRAELGDLFEAALASGEAGDAEPQLVANWVNELQARLGDADPESSKVTPAALAKLAGMVVLQGGHPGRPPSRCSTRWSRTAATRSRSSRRRGWAPSAAPTSSRPSCARRSRPIPTSRTSCAPAT